MKCEIIIIYKIVIGKFKLIHGNEKLIFNSIFIYLWRLFRLLNDEKHFKLYYWDIFQNKIKLNGSNGKVFILFLVYFIY